MHPEIRQWPSREFYRDELVDGRGTLSHFSNGYVSSGIRFVNIASVERRANNSFSNDEEARYIAGHIRDNGASYRAHDLTVGIICMYSAQVNLVRTLCSQQGLSGKDFTCDTVDGFQGGEKDVIYISCVRSNASSSVGFVDDPRRLNVAATRAKQVCIFVGNLRTLMGGSQYFKSLGGNLKARNLVYDP